MGGGCLLQALPAMLAQEHQLRTQLNDFFVERLQHRICPEVGVVSESREHLPRHFMVDLLYKPTAEDAASKFTVIEVNPFDAEFWGAYAGSTGLFRYKDAATGFLEDFDTLLGFHAFDKRVKKQFGTADAIAL